MPKDIRLIGLDLDNTVLNAHKELTPRVRTAIHKAIEAGIFVLPATGRALTGLPPELMSIPGIRFALTSNGAAVYDLKEDNAILICHCFEQALALKMLDIFLTFDALTAVFIGGDAFAHPFNPEDYVGAYTASNVEYIRKSRTQVADLHQLVLNSDKPVEKFNVMFRSPEERERAIEVLAQYKDSCAVTSSVPGNLEINTKGANKGASLLELGQMLGIAHDQVMAIGDGSNDLEMLKAVGYGVAMANSAPELLAIADAVTASAEEDGVALAIEAILA